MQVVYSGGSTPSPSPRLQRKTGYGRPIMPGYMTHVHPQILVQRSREKLTEGDTALRDSIPAMSKCVAIVCLLLNVVLPGFGTLTAGLSVLCCSHVRPKGDSKGHCIWVNAGVALVQFLLTFLFLLGWIWSIMWGVAFLSVSKQYYYKRHDKDDEKNHRQTEKSRTKIQTKSPHASSRVSSSSSSTKKHPSHQPGEDVHAHHIHHQQHLHTHLEVSPEAEASESACTPSATSGHHELQARKNHVVTNSNGYSSVSSAVALPREPIIVLQQVPQLSQQDCPDIVPPAAKGETIMKARTRHMKILQRKMSDNELSPFVLTHQQLEAIVIHDMPVHAPGPRVSPHPSELETGLPKA